MYYPLSALLIECLILSIVKNRDSYGYDISQTIKTVATIKESTLYPILKKLTSDGYLTTYTETVNNRARKYYAITDSGREHLTYLEGEWQEYRNAIDAIIKGGCHDE
ncbi:MAG: PadR family transcriptional regulator [Peptococcaceae bacterium]